jgi:hypothetical protein
MDFVNVHWMGWTFCSTWNDPRTQLVLLRFSHSAFHIHQCPWGLFPSAESCFGFMTLHLQELEVLTQGRLWAACLLLYAQTDSPSAGWLKPVEITLCGLTHVIAVACVHLCVIRKRVVWIRIRVGCQDVPHTSLNIAIQETRLGVEW